jgi:flagellar basal-body rod modification protein FlgD
MNIGGITTGSGAAAASGSTNTDAASDRFLRLLVAQMKNQDPLNPMDNAQVTSQMAQINTVTGIEKLNGTVQELSSQFLQLQTMQGATLVGRDVVVPGNRLDVDAGIGRGGFELESAADSVKVEIVSGSGAVVGTIELGAQTGGVHDFAWDASAHPAADGYSFRVVAKSGSVTKSVVSLMRDRVDAVSTAGNNLMLQLEHGASVAYGSVRSFH